MLRLYPTFAGYVGRQFLGWFGSAFCTLMFLIALSAIFSYGIVLERIPEDGVPEWRHAGGPIQR